MTDGAAAPRPDAWQGYFVWAAWLGLTAAAGGLAVAHGQDVPTYDEWCILPELTGEAALTWGWLWGPHNEHRIPCPKLVMVALARLTGADFRAGSAVNVAALSAAAACLIGAARRLRGSTRSADAFLPLALLSWGHFENILHGFQVQFTLSTLFVALLLRRVVLAAPRPSRTDVLVVVALAAVLTGCGANGAVFAPAVAAWFAVAAARAWAGGDAPARRSASGYALAAAACAALVPAYFSGLPRGHHPWAPADAARVGLQYLAMAFGPFGIATFPVSAAVVVATAAAAGAGAAAAWWAGPAERRGTHAGLFAILAGAAVLAAGVALGRAAFGPEAGFTNRYGHLAVSLLVAGYLVFVALDAVWAGRAAQAGLFAAVLLATPDNYRAADAYARVRDRIASGMTEGLDEGLTAAEAARAYTEGLGWNEFLPLVLDGMALLERRHLGPYRRPVAADPARHWDAVRCSELLPGSAPAAAFLSRGWSPGSGATGDRWAIGPKAAVRFRAAPGSPLRLALTLHPFVHGERLPRQRLGLVVNGRMLGEVVLGPGGLRDVTVAVPADAAREFNRLELLLPDAKSPSEVGHNPDPRRLGVLVTRIVASPGSDGPGGAVAAAR